MGEPLVNLIALDHKEFSDFAAYTIIGLNKRPERFRFDSKEG
jgi:hypothetical protein